MICALDRDVERRHRLVADDEVAAPSPARARCRRAGAGRRTVDADSVRPCSGAGRPRSAARRRGRARLLPFDEAIDPHRLGDDLADRHARIERANRDPGRSPGCRGGTSRSSSELRRVMSAPLKCDRPAVGSSSRRIGAADRGLAAAGFADEPDRLARRDIETRRRRPLHRTGFASEPAPAAAPGNAC